MRLWRRHPINDVGYHFYLPLNPHHLLSVDLFVARLNIFFPFYVSVSFGMLGNKGFQVGGGVKYDPTESLKLGENDYLFSAHFRVHKLGENCRVNSMASL